MKDRSLYRTFSPGTPLAAAFPKDCIPLMQMEHLRQMDLPISRGISCERTVDEFLQQIALNDSLRTLRGRREMAVLLNKEGALVRENGRWTLYFTPNRSERRTLRPDADLYDVLADIMVRPGVCRVTVPERSLKELVAGTSSFCILDEYCKSYPGRYLAVAESIVLRGTEELFAHVPVCRYGALSTVDRSEIENYHSITALLTDYIYNFDHGVAQKPLSVAVFGPPGSGKSFGVKQIANSRGRFAITSLNLSQYSSVGELFAGLHRALECAPERIPLIFFDEFDSELNGVARGWLKYFLAPMQDGEYTLEGNLYTIPAAVFVFAGATASSFGEFLPADEEQTKTFQTIKGPDFVSRLKGVLNIKGPNRHCATDRKHIIRRAMLLRSIIERNVPGICREDGTADISLGLLSTLLRVSEYRHGSRSIELIIGMSRLAGVTRFTPSCLPLAAQLDIHVDVKDFMRKLSFEQVMGSMVEQYAYAAHEQYRRNQREQAARRGLDAGVLAADPEMAEWVELDEFYKEGHRSQIRYLGEKVTDPAMEVGLRPVLEGAADTINELYGPILEKLAGLEHERWMKDKEEDGWQKGKKDGELKLSPEMVPYEELEESTREFIRLSVRDLPLLLKEIGYELYRKVY